MSPVTPPPRTASLSLRATPCNRCKTDVAFACPTLPRPMLPSCLLALACHSGRPRRASRDVRRGRYLPLMPASRAVAYTLGGGPGGGRAGQHSAAPGEWVGLDIRPRHLRRPTTYTHAYVLHQQFHPHLYAITTPTSSHCHYYTYTHIYAITTPPPTCMPLLHPHPHICHATTTPTYMPLLHPHPHVCHYYTPTPTHIYAITTPTPTYAITTPTPTYMPCHYYAHIYAMPLLRPHNAMPLLRTAWHYLPAFVPCPSLLRPSPCPSLTTPHQPLPHNTSG